MDRPFIEATIDQLEEIFQKHKHKRPVLAQLRDELGYRNRPRAKQLLREVQGVLDGTVPLDEPPPEDSADYQMSLDELLDDGSDDEQRNDANQDEGGEDEDEDEGD